MLRLSGKEALIMATAADTVDEDVAVQDTEEVVATAEMVSQAVDVEAIEAREMHKQLCSTPPGIITSGSRTKLNFPCGVSKSFNEFAISASCGSKQHTISGCLGLLYEISI